MSESIPSPVSQQLADAILSALREIGTAEGDTATPTVEETSSLGNIPVDQKMVLVEVDAEAIEEDEPPVLSSLFVTNWELAIFVHESPTTEYPPRQRVRQLRSDVIKKLKSDENYQWGGLAVNTIIRGWAWIDNAEDLGALDGCVLRFSTKHREQINDPYILR